MTICQAPSTDAIGRARLRDPVRDIACALAIALPWLSPLTSGPSASVLPWLLSAFAMALLAGLGGMARLPTSLWAGALALAAWAVFRGSAGLDAFALCGAIALLLLAASTGATLARREEGMHAIAWAWLLAALASSAIALWQYQGWAQTSGGWISSAPVGEAYGNLRQRNQFATLTAIGLCALAWLFSRGLRLSVALPMVVLLAVANAATTSRTGLLQILLLAGFCAGLPGPRRRARVALCLVGLLAWVAAAMGLPWLLALRGLSGGGLLDRVAGVGSCSSRLVLWSNVLHLIAQRPWLGWGWGELDYAHYATLYEGPRFCDILDNAHNLPLHLAVELGVPATLLVLAGGAWACIRLAPWRETEGARRLAWAVLGVIGLHSMVEYPLWYGPFQMAAGLAVGLLCAQPGRDLRTSTRAASSVLVLALAGYASVDYWRISQIYLPVSSRHAYYAGDTLARISDSQVFRDQVAFAGFTLTPVTADNAAQVLRQGLQILHFSPEPRVIEKVIDSARLLGREDVVAWQVPRFRAAFPREYAAWSARAAQAK